MKNSPQSPQPQLGVFHVSCWIMGLVAFAQLMSVGAAMAFRTNPAADPEIVTRVEYVRIESKNAVVATPPAPRGLTKAEMEVLMHPRDRSPISEPTVLRSAPAIADPVIERLVNDARSARISGDPMKAMTKLEEAQLKEPENPNVLYELAVCYETMGIIDSAIDYYVKVRGLGPLKGGSLWRKASLKVEKGLVKDVSGLASLGAVRKMLPEQTPQGERRGITLSISVAPGQELDPMLLTPRVSFFEKVDGKIVGAMVEESEEGRGNYWMNKPVNYQDGEEMVEVWYLVRDQGYAAADRQFHGFVAELYYDGKLVDIVAHPRTLQVEMRTQKASGDPTWDRLLEGLENRGAGGSLLPQMPSYEDR